MLPRGCFVYPPEEAKEREVTQIGVSACGATSLINTLVSLLVVINLILSCLFRLLLIGNLFQHLMRLMKLFVQDLGN